MFLKQVSIAPVIYRIFFSISLLISLFVSSSAIAAEVSGEAYPPHVDLTTLAIVLGLRGQQGSEEGLPVVLTPEVARQLTDSDFHYEGFILHQILINGYATIRDEPDAWHARGMLIFEDLAGRRAYTQFSAFYRIQQDGIEIYRAAARTLTPATPAFVWFALRSEDVTPEMLEPENHAELVQLAGTHSLSSIPSQSADYVIFALSMDRFSDQDQISFEADSHDISVKTLNLGGWPVGIFSGRMAPGAVGGDLSIHLSGDAFASSEITLQDFPTRPFEWDVP